MDRRTILKWLGFGSAAAVAPASAAVATVATAPAVGLAAGAEHPPLAPLPVGMVMPRFTHRIAAEFSSLGINSSYQAVALYEYQIWSGTEWLELNSKEGAEVRSRVMRGDYG